MKNIYTTLVILGLSVGIVQFGKLRAHWVTKNAPEMNPSDIQGSPLPVDDQRKLLVQFEHEICEAFLPCSQVKDPSAQRACEESAKKISGIAVPNQLPSPIVKNLKIYHQSMVNSASKLADAWDTTGKEGGTFWTHMVNWEIDTCSPQSIPQKIYRLYQLDVMTNSSVVTCKEIEQLHGKRLPASL